MQESVVAVVAVVAAVVGVLAGVLERLAGSSQRVGATALAVGPALLLDQLGNRIDCGCSAVIERVAWL